jgi:hypothetical protein
MDPNLLDNFLKETVILTYFKPDISSPRAHIEILYN